MYHEEREEKDSEKIHFDETNPKHYGVNYGTVENLETDVSQIVYYYNGNILRNL